MTSLRARIDAEARCIEAGRDRPRRAASPLARAHRGALQPLNQGQSRHRPMARPAKRNGCGFHGHKPILDHRPAARRKSRRGDTGEKTRPARDTRAERIGSPGNCPARLQNAGRDGASRS